MCFSKVVTNSVGYRARAWIGASISVVTESREPVPSEKSGK
jgi:hypothetical protein